MTVQEVIDELLLIDDKSIYVCYDDNEYGEIQVDYIQFKKPDFFISVERVVLS